MKKFFLSLFLFIFSLFIFAIPAFAEQIISFQSEIKIKKNATAQITETINYDFNSIKKHGIFRKIPSIKKNKQGQRFKLKYNLISVKDENGNPYKYTTSYQDENWVIKIGDPKKTITGSHTYLITYTVLGNITYFSDHDEFYWNATGNDWQVPILSAQVTYLLPDDIPEPTKAVCYTGSYQSSSQNCTIEKLSSSTFRITTQKPLSPYEGLTTDVSFPINIIAYVEPEKIEEFTLPFWAWTIIVLLAFIYYFLTPLIVIFLYLKYGRDPKVGIPVRAWYDPPKDKTNRKLTAAETGTLLDEYVDDKEITATIVSLAIKGYLKIEVKTKKGFLGTKKTFAFYKKKQFANDSSLCRHEKIILNRLFEGNNKFVTTKDLKETFYLTANKFKKNLYQKMVDLGFFLKDPEKTRKTYYTIAILTLFTGNILLAVTCLIFARAMPKKTLFGAKQNNVAKGLKNFLTSQERQLEFQAQNWYFFEKLLPFAIAFGVEKVWAERFKDLKFTPPDWYDDPDFSRSFNTLVFTNSLRSSLSPVQAASRPPSTSTTSTSGFSSGFGGGGFSGGGGGGGGGGSW